GGATEGCGRERDNVAARHPNLIEGVVVMHDEDPLHRSVGEDFVVAHDPLITSLRQHLWSTEHQPRRRRNARQRRAGEDEFVAEGGGGRAARPKRERGRVWRDVV